MFSMDLTGIHFSRSVPSDEKTDPIVKNRYFQFQFQFLDKVIVYDEVLQESDLFCNPRLLRNYSIVLHAIRSDMLQSDVKVVFGLIDEEKKNEFCIAWEISLALLLFGPSEMCIPHSQALDDQNQYNLIFRNRSRRVNDYSVGLHSIQISKLFPSTYTYLYFLKYPGKRFEKSIECISKEPVVIQNDYTLPLSESSRVPLSLLSDTSLELQLFNSEHEKTSFSFALSNLLLSPLCHYSFFSISTPEGPEGPEGPEVNLSFETEPLDEISSCVQSKQYLEDYTVKNTLARTTQLVIPVEIIESSFILPHSSLSLSLTTDGYSFQKDDIVILTIPYSTIEKSSLLDKKTLGGGVCLGTVSLSFNRANKVFSDWIQLRIAYEEDHPLWELLNLTPQLTQHKKYHFEKCIHNIWMELKNKRDHTIYYNSATGRLTSAIPKKRKVTYAFASIEDLRPVDLVVLQGSSIIVKGVSDEKLRKQIAAGYQVDSILFNQEEEWTIVAKENVYRICELLMQPLHYPLQMRFRNPYC